MAPLNPLGRQTCRPNLGRAAGQVIPESSRIRDFLVSPPAGADERAMTKMDRRQYFYLPANLWCWNGASRWNPLAATKSFSDWCDSMASRSEASHIQSVGALVLKIGTYYYVRSSSLDPRSWRRGCCICVWTPMGCSNVTRVGGCIGIPSPFCAEISFNTVLSLISVGCDGHN